MASRWLETDLPPDVFAVVMATGIVSIAAYDHAYRRISLPLLVLACALFVALVAGLAVRVVARPGSALGELGDPDVALRLFTAVAACAVLGTRLDAHPTVLWALSAGALAGWLLLAPVGVRDVWSRPRAELRDHVHGAWLLPSVATSGLAVVGSELAVRHDLPTLAALAAVAWLLSLAIYVAVTWLIVWRALSGPFVPEQVTPDSWILMGGLAIATLASVHVLTTAYRFGAPGWMVTAVHGAVLGSWVLSSLWIPPLLYAEAWRVDQRAGSLHFAGVWWSAVFPLGMYSTATAATARALHQHSLVTISLVFFWIAFTVWILVAVGSLHFAVRARHGTHAPSRENPAPDGVRSALRPHRARLEEAADDQHQTLSGDPDDACAGRDNGTRADPGPQ